MAKIKNFKPLLVVIALLLVVAVVFTMSRSDGSETGDTSDKAVDDTVTPAPESSQTATYMIEYDASWSSETHPATLPDGAHVSPIVVVAHKNENDLFASGLTASDGIEMMAETGATQVLLSEIDNNPLILGSVVGQRIDVPGSNSLELEFDRDHSLLSAVSMLAPSPDWFVAVSNVDLFQDGQWLDEIELEVRAYDSGTDSGPIFTAPDSDADPAVAISGPRDEEFAAAASENAFATIRITRKRD